MNAEEERSSRDHQQAIKQNKRIRSITTLSPAFSRQELLDVGQALLSVETHHPTKLSIPEALEYVVIWRLRQPRLPHSIASTAALAEILWNEQQGNNNHASPTERSHAYAAAVLRAINGLADPMQQHRTMAASVAVLCDSIGIPSWLVDIRHQATHQALPSLPVLRLAAGTLLQVFQTVYWAPYRAYVEGTVERARGLLRAYQNASMALRPDDTATPASPAPLQEAPPPPPKEPPQMITNSSSEGDDEDRTNWRDGLAPQLGSNTNRFAALMVPKKTKKREAEQSKTAQQKSPKRPKKKKKESLIAAKVVADERSAAAAAYVQADLPLDIAYDAALDFLRERRQQRPADDVPLVQALCRAWPGWLTFLQQQPDDRIQDLLVLAKVVPAGNKKKERMVKQTNETTEAPSVNDQQQPERRTNMWEECKEWKPCAIGEPPLHYK